MMIVDRQVSGKEKMGCLVEVEILREGIVVEVVVLLTATDSQQSSTRGTRSL